MNRYLFGMLILLATSLMGSSFAVGKIGLSYISPLLLVGIRFTMAGLIMALLVRSIRQPASFKDYQMLFGGLLLLLLSFVLESPHLIINAASLGVVIYLILMGSIVQFATWYYLLSRSDPGKTSAFLFLAPFFGVLSGRLILGEDIHKYVYYGGLCIFIGIFLVNWTKVDKKLF